MEHLAATDIDTAELVTAIVDLFDTWVRAEHVDPEEMDLTGVAIGQSRRPGVDAALAGWLGPEPAERRTEILSWFLFGYFRHACAVSREAWSALAPELPRLRPDSMACAGVVLALHSVVLSRAEVTDHERAWIRGLLQAQASRLRGAGAQQGIVSLISRTR